MSDSPHIIYLSFDGLLEPLGETQVVRLVEELNRTMDLRFTIVSLEKRSDLANTLQLNNLQERLRDQGISWHHHPYEKGAGGAARNVSMMLYDVGQLAEDSGCSLLHARSYLAAAVCDTLKAANGTPYVFDFRGYWIDERIEEGRWFINPIAVAAGRAIERRLFGHANAIVSLAQPAADDIQRGRFGDVGSTPIAVIPTCVDATRFNLNQRTVPRPRALAGKNVVGWVGSLNASYLVQESLELTRWILEYDPDAFFLGLTGQVTQLRERALAAGIPETRMLIQPVQHADMPQWLGWIDWGLLLLKTNVAKRGSMPTKLGEFLASGVRPIYHGCNEDMESLVTASGTGVHVDFSKPLEEFALDIIHSEKTVSLEEGWNRVEDRLSLRAGVEMYARLYDLLLP